MASYQLTKEADADLTEIYRFSYQQFGESQADAYLLSLDTCFELLADNKHIGISINHIKKSGFQFSHASHNIFYQHQGDDILILRVLHKTREKRLHF